LGKKNGLFLLTCLFFLGSPLELPHGLRAQAEVFNSLNAKVSDIDGFPSRLPGESDGGIDDIHFHPTPPRSARFGIVYGF
jgi:hypothetical protein